jgi:member of the syntaxin family of t-SNAREs
MQNQDEQLDGVSYTVGNLRQQAREMGEELEDQVMYVTSSLPADG